MEDRQRTAAAGAAAGGVTLRQLAGAEDFRACFELQRLTWGMEFEGLVPPSVLKIVPKTGGIVAGAFGVNGGMLGFVLGLTGVRPPGGRRDHAVALLAGTSGESPEIFHWSHMLAVAPAARDLGVGRRLKLYQRELLLPLGVAAMEWTYDPLEARNAHLNLNVLGAEVVEYVEDMYKGESGSDLAKGLGTDRFIVSWRLAAAVHADGDLLGVPAVVDLPAGPSPAMTRFAAAPRIDPAPPEGGRPPLPAAPRVLVEVPARIQDFKEAQPERALAYRLGTRRAFESYLSKGYRVTAFLRGPDGRCHYGVERGES
jgi:chorismate synthase